MKKYKFISTLRFLSITEPINGWITLMPGIDITNDKSLTSQILDQEFKEMAGIIEYQHFIDANNILYCELDETHFKHSENSHQALNVWLVWLKWLLNDLWFIKDNSVICEAAFCKLSDGNHTSWTKNYLPNSVFKSSGISFEDTELSIEELRQWDEKSNQIQAYLYSSNSTFKDSFTNTNFSRFGRGMRFIEAATKETHPAVKIAHYCSAFESLFSTDNAELSHKLSEIVALFLKEHGFNPIQVFDDIKSFYSVRSKVTHGDSMKTSKEQMLSDMSLKCDNYLRVIFNALLNNKASLLLFDGKKDDFESFFKNKLFAG